MKQGENFLSVFLEGIGIYAKHFITFTKYMAFPIFGQILGIILAFGLSLGFAFYAVDMFKDSTLTLSITLCLTIPGIYIFVRAFWEYLTAYVSISSMTENTLKSGRIYDIDAHKQVVTKRAGSFITLWILFGLFTFIAIFPPMWFFSEIVFVLIILIFQVFTFEHDATPIQCFKRSFNLIKPFKTYMQTQGLFILTALFTYWLLPKVVDLICSILQIITFFAMLLDPLMTNLPINEFNAALLALKLPYVIGSLSIAKFLTSMFISTIVIGFTLPLRSIIWTLWYKKLAIAELKKKSKSKKKKASD